MTRVGAVGALLGVLLAGCANPVSRATYVRYRTAAIDAEKRGNLAASEELFHRAAVNARTGNLDPDERAEAFYNLGRIKRHLCKDGEAEPLLREAVTMAEAIPEPTHLPRRLLELGRLYHEMGRFGEAAPLLERGIQLLEPLGIEDQAPAAFADTLELYAITLRQLKHGVQAAAVEDRVKALRQRRQLTADPRGGRYEMRRCQVRSP